MPSVISVKNLETILWINFSCSGLNLITPSNLFLNSGEKNILIALSSFRPSSLVKPTMLSAVAPKFELIIKITFWKLILLPLLSVKTALSITCNNIFISSIFAFSISSSKRTQCGLFFIASVKSPPFSYPT